MIQRQSSRRMLCVGVGMPTPALLHSTWTAPNRSTRRRGQLLHRTPGWTRRRPGRWLRRPARSARRRTASSIASSRSASTRRMPADANARAMPSPIPLAPPVITATRPFVSMRGTVASNPCRLRGRPSVPSRHVTSDDPDRDVTPARWTQATVYDDMWVDPADDPREGGTAIVDERSMLLEYLRTQRLTLQMKCAGLDPAGLAARSVAPSTMSLLGLVRHMAEVERSWSRRVMAGEDAPRRYVADGDRDGDFNGAVADRAVVAEAFAALAAEQAFTDRFVAATAGPRPDPRVRRRRTDLAARGAAAPDRGVRPPQRSRRPAARARRRPRRPVATVSCRRATWSTAWWSAVPWSRAWCPRCSRRRRPCRGDRGGRDRPWAAAG